MSAEKLNGKASDENLTEQIIEFAREYHARDFPNPKQIGCPPKDALRKIVKSGNLPDEKMRLHLLSCSPCFQEFRLLRSEKTAVFPVAAEANRSGKKRIWTSFFRQPLPAFALILSAFGLLSGAIYFAMRERAMNEYAKQTQVETNIQTPIDKEFDKKLKSDATAESNQFFAELKPAESTTARSFTEPIAQSNKVKTAVPKTNKASENPLKQIVNLDLRKAGVTRGANAQETIYSLKAEPLTLNIKLPGNSPAGIYEISLLDEFGKPLTKTKTERSEGKRLQTKLNLSQTTGRARLCVALKGEIPDCLAVNVGNVR